MDGVNLRLKDTVEFLKKSRISIVKILMKL